MHQFGHKIRDIGMVQEVRFFVNAGEGKKVNKNEVHQHLDTSLSLGQQDQNSFSLN